MTRPRLRPSSSSASTHVHALGLGLVLVAAIAIGHGGGASASSAVPARADRLTGSITVSAAASLTGAFTEMGADFERRHPRADIEFNFASSSTLVAQIRGGAPADVFASADRADMAILVKDDQVTAEPVDFASNSLTIVVKQGNPDRVRSLADLAGVGIVSLCADTVPCGRYASRALARAGVTIRADRITRGQDVKAALTAVSAGDADAGIVYVTDARAAKQTVTAIRIPASLNVRAVYPIAPIASTGNARLARAWVDHAVSPAGQETMASFGFLPPPRR